MKKEELNSERTPSRDLAEQIHAANLRGQRYTASATVITTTINVPRIGPWKLPRLFHSRDVSAPKRKIFSLNPPNDTVVMVDDGTIALKNPKTQRYESFDFRTASSDNFDLVRNTLKRWKGLVPEVRSYKEQAERMEAKKSRDNNHHTPH